MGVWQPWPAPRDPVSVKPSTQPLTSSLPTTRTSCLSPPCFLGPGTGCSLPLLPTSARTGCVLLVPTSQCPPASLLHSCRGLLQPPFSPTPQPLPSLKPCHSSSRVALQQPTLSTCQPSSPGPHQVCFPLFLSRSPIPVLGDLSQPHPPCVHPTMCTQGPHRRCPATWSMLDTFSWSLMMLRSL